MSSALVWFRRDLRLLDNTALSVALERHAQVHCVFVFDRTILDALPQRKDQRVEFIWQSVSELQAALRAHGSDLHVLVGDPVDVIAPLARTLNINAVYANEDYEPASCERDNKVKISLQAQAASLNLFKDTVIFAKDEILTQQGQPFSVFTPYKNAWLKKLSERDFAEKPSVTLLHKLATQSPAQECPSLPSLGFETTNLSKLGINGGTEAATTLLNDFVTRIANYHVARDYPAIKGVSYLSVHNRFGTISIRQLVRSAKQLLVDNPQNQGASTWLSELIWRDFYFQILSNNPHIVSRCYKPAYDTLAWENNNEYFQAWCQARTGYPIVDAAMHQLNQTGYMHNRLRMIVASFLTKDLLIDWRWGERYFADQLLDFDLAANNGGWQWAASTGCDAQPYFRIFNPQTQSERFDPQGKFIRRYLPEIAHLSDKEIHAPGIKRPSNYPAPIVDHALQREKALAIFKACRAA